MWRVIGIDPGEDAGWSDWMDGRLMSCGLGPAPEVHAVDLVLVELPQIYPGGPKVDPQDLIKLAANAGRHVQRLHHLAPCLAVYPRNWKGQQDKEKHHRRVKVLIGPTNLAHAELCMAKVPAGKRHNVWDAVALGHWAIVQAMTGAKLGKSPLQTLQAITDYAFRPL